MSSSVDAITARLSAATISSAKKAREPVKAKEGALVKEPTKKSSGLFSSNRLAALTARISAMSPGSTKRERRWLTAEEIDHSSEDGRKHFFEQVCYLLKRKNVGK